VVKCSASEGDLQPKKQADIEEAMLSWLGKRGEHPAPSTIRPRARKLWQVISKTRFSALSALFRPTNDWPHSPSPNAYGGPTAMVAKTSTRAGNAKNPNSNRSGQGD
jgi:hypothetical protein